MLPRCCLLIAMLAASLPHPAQGQPAHAPEVPVTASQAPIHFDRVSVQDGLSQGSVYAILQDREGDLWFATQAGLDRYDGYDFTAYKPEPFDSTSLRPTDRLTLFEDRGGTLWVGTREGLSRFDRATERFTHVDLGARIGAWNVAHVAEAEDGTLWLGTSHGLARYDPATGEAEAYRHDPDDPATLSHNRVNGLYVHPDGTVWASTYNGLNALDPVTGTVQRFLVQEGLDPDDVTGKHLPNALGDVHVDPEAPDVLWLGGLGLRRFDARTGRVERFLPVPERPDDPVNAVVDLVADPSTPDALWMTSWSGEPAGLVRFDRASKTFLRYRHDPSNPASLGTDHLESVYADRSGMLWVGLADGQGLNKFDPGAGYFTHYRHVPGDDATISPGPIWGVAEDAQGLVWISVNAAGVDALDPATGQIRHFRHDPGDPRSLSSDLVFQLLGDGRGGVWASTDRGLDYFDRAQQRFTSVYRFGDEGSPGFVQTLYRGRDGTVWIGAQRGVYRWDEAARAFVEAGDALPAEAAAPNVVRTMAETEDGTFWFGTTAGLYGRRPSGEVLSFRYDPRDTTSLSWDIVHDVHERPREPGILWVATSGGGLNRLEVATGTITHFDEDDGLPNNTVYAILEDDAGHLWMSTNNGLSQFDPDAGTFSNYDVDRGLQAREFNDRVAMKARDGRLYFGGVNGLTSFLPSAIDRNEVPPEVRVRQVTLTRSTTPDGSRAFAPQPRDTLTLAHNQNDVAFDYVGVHYANPAKNRYRIQLEGYDPDWRDVGTARQATYTNLDPGTYTFKVLAASADGVWSPSGGVVHVQIRPPWWRTPWAYAGYVGMLLLGGFVVDRVQRRRLLRREREATRQREDRLRVEAAEAHARALQAENHRQTQELEQARQLQLSLLPARLPEHPYAELAAHMETATEVGGDYYDADVAPDGTLTVAIGDATGHGVQAGTMVTATKSVLNVLRGEQDLPGVFRRATKALRDMHLPGLYMAMALARLRGRSLELIGAGMPPALLVRAATGRLEQHPLKGMPLGSFADYPYTVTRLELAPGDTLVLMSDGFPELFDADGEMLGYDRAVELARAAVAEAEPSAESVLAALQAAVARRNGGARHDDVTFVVLRARPVPDEAPPSNGRATAADGAGRPVQST